MKHLFKYSIVVFLLTWGVVVNAQKNKKQPSVVIGDSKEYKQLKMSGQLGELISSGSIVVNSPNYDNPLTLNKAIENDNSLPPAQTFATTCYGYTPPNPAAIPTLANVDDSPSTGPIALPFNFCFYGTNYSACYLNANGNITFTQGYTAFTASAFPSAVIPPMLAPFWGDVDFSNGNGLAYYEIFSNAAIFHWVGAGYFNAQGDKLNTFQLIITDFTSPLLQPGTNVGFFYEDMNWTTGDASGGVGGYGGTAATVGVNEGNGIDYIQIGLFDGPGNSYDGPLGLNDDVDWLDNKTFMFDVCNSTNIPPIVVGIDFCDTLRLCVGDTLPVNVTFLAGELTQTVWASVDTSQASGFQITNNISGIGPSAQIDATFIGSISNVGVNIVTFMSYDNGSPSDTIQFDYIIVVDSISMYPIIMGDTSYCQGNTVLLDGGVGFDSYLWSNGDTSQTTNVMQGLYTVQTILGGCSVISDTFEVVEFLNPVVQIFGDTIYCPGDSVLLNATQGYDSYLWSTSINDTLDSVYVTQGIYTVTVTDTNTCVGISSAINVMDFINTVNITGDTIACLGDSVLLNAGSGYDSYTWSTGPNDTLDNIYVSQGTYTVVVTAFGCVAFDSHTVLAVSVPIPLITGDTAYCQGSGALLDGGPGYTNYLWNTSPPQSTQIVSISQAGTYTVTGTFNGCTSTSLPFTVIENSLPTPVIIGDLHYCSNDSNGAILSTVNTYLQYSWSSGDTSPFIVANSLFPFYTVVVTDSNGCTGLSSAVVVTSSAPDNNITGNSIFCEGETITISSDPGFSSYLWSNGSSSESISVGSGMYLITVTDSFGCADIDTINLTANAVPIASISIAPSGNGETGVPVIITDESTINNGAIVGWNWDFDFTMNGGVTPSFEFTQGSHSVVFDNQGTYGIWLEVTSDNGCKDTVFIEYLVIDDIIVPNVFTPNNDGMNDFLVFKNLEYQPSNHLVIFDRWGRNILELNNYNNDWDGDGHSAGTYFFILTVPDIELIKGSFTILR